jgi:hypothetical protein
MTEKRSAKDIGDAEFLTAYNNASLTNQQVVDALNADGWTPIGVKLRSEKLRACLTVVRTGAIARDEHHAIAQSELTGAARQWLLDGTIPGGSSPSSPRPQSQAAAVTAGDEDGDGDGDGDGEGDGEGEIPDAPPASTKQEPGAIVPNEDEFAFHGTLYGVRYKFAGRTKDAAIGALMGKLRELNFSKVQITDAGTAQLIGLNDFVSGGNYSFTKQLTAAAWSLKKLLQHAKVLQQPRGAGGRWLAA